MPAGDRAAIARRGIRDRGGSKAPDLRRFRSRRCPSRIGGLMRGRLALHPGWCPRTIENPCPPAASAPARPPRASAAGLRRPRCRSSRALGPSPGMHCGSGNSDHFFSGNSGHLKAEKSSDSLPPDARADEPRRREAKEDDRSHGQTSSAGAARGREDAEADRRGDRGVAAQRACEMLSASASPPLRLVPMRATSRTVRRNGASCHPATPSSRNRLATCAGSRSRSW
jgi:hypothetical protein